MAHASPDAKALGRYRLLGLLGEGAFGRVYRASDTANGVMVALKELSHASGASLARFKREFRALSHVSHPNVVQMLELFESDGRWFIAMGLVEGVDFLTWVQGGVPAENDNAIGFDPLRLRTSLLGIAEGLSAVHASGLLHRDLKPANIRVTTDGRPVLLDFGLLTAVSSLAQSTHAGIVGSPAYMAPEQANSEKVTAAADWYSLGVCLYEALTGRLPFTAENPLAVLIAKQRTRPIPPREVVRNTAPIALVLDDLCMRLLEPDVSRRAGEKDVFEALHQLAAADPVVSQSRKRYRHSSETEEELTGPLDFRSMRPMPPSLSALAGRESELALLANAAAKTQQGLLRVVLVEGESGIGKSALVNEAARHVLALHRDALILKGRCYENERVPYKAFDGCMDQLARALRRFEPEQVRALLPPRARLIAQLFPVLADVKEVRASSDAGASEDPSSRRLEAFRALASLLHKLALERPIVLLIDDLQWADLESFHLLRVLVAEAPPLLLLFTVRPREELVGDTAVELRTLRDHPSVEVLPLTGLPLQGAHTLASRLLASSATPEWLDAIARESQGHPMFIDVLARYASSHDVGEARSISLDAALTSRIAGLSMTSRRLLALLALAGRPHSRKVFEQALGTPLDDALFPLLSQNLARARGAHQIVCFHDRVRALAVQQIEPGVRAELHRALATALARVEDADPNDATVHWEQAGERDRAAAGCERAAEAALKALAFTRAAECYQQALALTSDAQEQKRLSLLHADALARSKNTLALSATFLERVGSDSRDRSLVAIAVPALLLVAAILAAAKPWDTEPSQAPRPKLVQPAQQAMPQAHTELENVSVPAGKVVVTLQSTPPGANVTVGDRDCGPTPVHIVLSGEEAAIGRVLEFRFALDGFMPQTVVRSVDAQKILVDSGPLRPVSGAVP